MRTDQYRYLANQILVLTLVVFCFAGPLALGQSREAEEIDLRARALDLLVPDGFGGALYNGYLHLFTNRHQPSMDHFKALSEANPDAVEPVYGMAMVHTELGEYRQALELHKKILLLKPAFLNSLINKGILHIYLGELEKAEQTLLKAQRLAKGDKRILLLLGQVYAIRGDSPGRAIAALRSAYKGYANETEINVELGTQYYKTENYALAAFFFDRARKLGFEGERVLLALAKCHYYEDNLAEAIPLLKELLVDNPDSAEGQRFLGACYVKQEAWTQAFMAFTRAREIDEDDATSLFYIAYSQNQLGLTREALTSAVRYRAEAFMKNKLDDRLLRESLKLIRNLERILKVERLPGQEIGSVRDMVRIEAGAGVENPYYIGTFEVSMAEYQMFVKATGWRSPEGAGGGKARDRLHWTEDGAYPAGSGDLPVVWVTYEDAAVYAAWCGKRLPTLAEWKKAARGENQTASYPWGGSQPDGEQARYDEKDGPRPVRQGKPNSAGLINIVGNVAEWCYSSGHDPENPEELICPVAGGHWRSAADELKIDAVPWNKSTDKNPFTGIRLAIFAHEVEANGR